MRPVHRDEILDYLTYEERREVLRARMLEEKRKRRLHLGPVLTFLFENTDTVRYQVQEMVRTERMVREADIRHELEVYNELLGEPGELGCTLLIEIDEPRERDAKLKAWLRLPQHLYARMEDGRRCYARFDPRQVGDERLSSVQFLRFPVGGETPRAIGSDLAGIELEVELTPETRAALNQDLAS